MSFEEIIAKFADMRILVVGDVMLDRFVYGDVHRISPEAPTAVLKATRPHDALGGAANVARNIVRLGAKCDLVGVAGRDDASRLLSGLLTESGIDHHLVSVDNRHTTVKMRFVAHMHNTHLLRADWEDAESIGDRNEQDLLEKFEELLSDSDAVILSDYKKGVLTDKVLSGIIKILDGAKPIIVDPKGSDFTKYRGATAITPNVAELRSALGYDVKDDDDSLFDAARRVLDQTQIECILVTRSEKGVLFTERNAGFDTCPATAKRVVDVSGAGDTLVAGFALALAAGASVRNAAQLANAAAGIAVAKPGTSVASEAELRDALLSRPHFDVRSKWLSGAAALDWQIRQWRQEGLSVGFTNGCFDVLHPGHIHILQNARSNCDRLIVGLNSDASVRRLKGPSRPVQDEAARATVMAALAFVDAVAVFDEDTPLALIERIKPDVLLKGADYRIDQVVGREIVEAAGGRVVLIELVPDRSTTNIVKRISAGRSTGEAVSSPPDSIPSRRPAVSIRLGRKAKRWLDAKPHPALFLDRDGVIIADTHYVSSVQDVVVLPHVARYIRYANSRAVPIIVVSNQSGVGRGYFRWSDVGDVDDRIADILAQDDAFVDLTLYCGAGPDDDPDTMSFRKPSPGMLTLAGRMMSIDMERSALIGDQARDLAAAADAGLGYGILAGRSEAYEDLAGLERDHPHFRTSARSNIDDAFLSAFEYLEQFAR